MFVDGTTGGVPGTGAAGIDSNSDGVADGTDFSQLSPAFDTNRDGSVNSGDDKFAVGLQLQGYAAGVTPISNVGGGSGQILLPDGALPPNNGPKCWETTPPTCATPCWAEVPASCPIPCWKTSPPTCQDPCPDTGVCIPQPGWRRRSWRELTDQ